MNKLSYKEKQNELKNFSIYLKKANDFINSSIIDNNENNSEQFRNLAILELEKLLSFTDITDYLLLDSNPVFSKDKYLETLFQLGTLYKTNAEHFFKKKHSNYTEGFIELVFRKAVNHYTTILRVNFENKNATTQIVSIFTQLCSLYSENLEKCVSLLQECLIVASDSDIIHYNLGFVFQKLNKLEQSVIHYKLSISLLNYQFQNKKIEYSEKQRIKNLLLNSYNGISSVYRSIKSWPESLYYLLKAENVDSSNPDIQNALGVVYTEMRRTDLAEIAYLKAIKNADKAIISKKNNLLSEIYLNFGHMQSYNGDNNKSIECYNKSLEISPGMFLAFQNKIMNLSYVFDELTDKLYITKQHKLINKLLSKSEIPYLFTKELFTQNKINIGIISGDFAEHPVSYFIRPFLKNFDNQKFNVTCYSECLIDTSLFNENLHFKFIKNMSAKQASDLIYNDKIHILLDLAGHTAYNRLDVFALKPCPIQISYIGYPFSTGLKEIDYRITDNVCDNQAVSQEYYTEKLLYLDNCFLCYDPLITKKNSVGQLYKNEILPLTKIQPFLNNKFLTIGCFNRLNKITDSVIKIFNSILLKFQNVKFMFKTKALLNKNIKQNFIKKFDNSVRNRLLIVDCTILHDDHLLEYNNVDIAIDTFPYSGTTTSCEALYMGVPVFTFYDKTYFFHPQNVTASLLKNSHSDLSFYIVDNQEELHKKLDILLSKPNDFWESLKPTVRTQFLNGDVCNQQKYTKNISNLFSKLIDEKLQSIN